MRAKDKTRPFTAFGEAMRDEVISDASTFPEVNSGDAKELLAPSERFAAVLRTAPVEDTVKAGQRDIRHVLFSGDKRLLWTTTSESEWHRYVCKPIKPSTVH